MAKVLDIAIETVGGSLNAILQSLAHNAFMENPYTINIRVIAHALLCASASYSIWQFTRATTDIDIKAQETALYLMLLLVNWFVASAIYFGILRNFRCKAKFKDIFTVYTFVHSNILLLASVASLVVFVFFNDFAITRVELELVRQVQQGLPFDVVTTTTTYLLGVQVVFLALAVAMILFYEPAHIALVTDARRGILYVITALLTSTSILIQVRQWSLTSTSSEILNRIIIAPNLIPH
ncbi:hypothetical protein [Limimaricola sp. AA108-03]|uniref:hypothetical protein n=1 Tax=Limimaricola sp. AA108-03 TaxID=3425945 RepID=UPI003D78888F